MNIHSYMYQRDRENHSVPKNLTWFKNYEFICFSWYFHSDDLMHIILDIQIILLHFKHRLRYKNMNIRAHAYERRFQC